MIFSPLHLAVSLALVILISLQPSYLFDPEGTTIKILTREYCNRNNPIISKLVHKLIRCRETVSSRESVDRFKECWQETTKSDYPSKFSEWKEFLCSDSFDTHQRQIRECYNKDQTESSIRLNLRRIAVCLKT